MSICHSENRLVALRDRRINSFKPTIKTDFIEYNVANFNLNIELLYSRLQIVATH